MEHLDFVKKNKRITNRYEQYLAKLCEKIAITSVSELEAIDKINPL